MASHGNSIVLDLLYQDAGLVSSFCARARTHTRALALRRLSQLCAVVSIEVASCVTPALQKLIAEAEPLAESGLEALDLMW